MNNLLKIVFDREFLTLEVLELRKYITVFDRIK